MEIQHNQPVEESGFQAEAASTCSQIVSASYISHVGHSVETSGQPFLAGQNKTAIHQITFLHTYSKAFVNVV